MSSGLSLSKTANSCRWIIGEYLEKRMCGEVCRKAVKKWRTPRGPLEAEPVWESPCNSSTWNAVKHSVAQL